MQLAFKTYGLEYADLADHKCNRRVTSKQREVLDAYDQLPSECPCKTIDVGRDRERMQRAVANALTPKRPLSPERASAFIHLVFRSRVVQRWQSSHSWEEDDFSYATQWNSAAPSFVLETLYLPPKRQDNWRKGIAAAIIPDAVEPLADEIARQLLDVGCISKKRQRQVSAAVEAVINSNNTLWLSDFERWLDAASGKYQVARLEERIDVPASELREAENAGVQLTGNHRHYISSVTTVQKRKLKRFMERVELPNGGVSISQYPNGRTLAINPDDSMCPKSRPAQVSEYVVALIRHSKSSDAD